MAKGFYYYYYYYHHLKAGSGRNTDLITAIAVIIL